VEDEFAEYSHYNIDAREITAVEKMGLLVILTGPTAVGKSTIKEGLIKSNPDMASIVSTTTRQPRNGEIDGLDYHFVDKRRFTELAEADSFLEINEYDGNLYGTEKADVTSVTLGKDLIWIISMLSACRLPDIFLSAFGQAASTNLLKRTLILLVGVPKLTILRDRFKDRHQPSQIFLKRLRTDWLSWKTENKLFSNVVMNRSDMLDSTMKEIQKLIEQHRIAQIKGDTI